MRASGQLNGRCSGITSCLSLGNNYVHGVVQEKTFACGNNEIYVARCGGVVLKNYIRYGHVGRVWISKEGMHGDL